MEPSLGLANAAFVDEEYESALAHYDAAVDAEPSSTDALAKRAACQLKLGRHAAAAADAGAACAIEPSAVAHRRAGLAHFALRDFAAARSAFEGALSLSGAGCSPSAGPDLRRWVRKCDAEIAAPTDVAAAPDPAPDPSAPPAAAASAAAAPAAPQDPSKIRHEWYQTHTHVVVSVLARQAPTDGTAVRFTDAGLEVTIDFGDAGKYALGLSLFSKVVPAECTFAIAPSKVEVKLKKAVAGKWEKLEGDGSGGVSAFNTATSEVAPRTVYSGSRKDWDAIDRDVKRAEEEEKPEGEEALNKLFKQIYANASEETRRAMNKSFQTCGVASSHAAQLRLRPLGPHACDATELIARAPDGSHAGPAGRCCRPTGARWGKRTTRRTGQRQTVRSGRSGAEGSSACSVSTPHRRPWPPPGARSLSFRMDR